MLQRNGAFPTLFFTIFHTTSARSSMIRPSLVLIASRIFIHLAILPMALCRIGLQRPHAGRIVH